jgi:hypothetical protein
MSENASKIKLKLCLGSHSSGKALDGKSDSNSECLMEVSPSTLSHIIETLEIALLESKAHRTRIFVKAFNG